MKVLVDTSVWSLALRRKKGALSEEERRLTGELKGLVEEGRVVMPGLIRQELLSGLREEDAFERLRGLLEPFEDYPVATADHETAARLSNTARRQGVTVSTIDALIAAVALNSQLPVFTTDKDFQHLAKVVEVPLHTPQD
jgi:predicted nucleic acid-binding protein